MEEQGIREDDEIKMCELFDQYERRGRIEGEKFGRAEGEKFGRAEGEKIGMVKGKIDDIMDFLKGCGEIPKKLCEEISKEQDIDVLKGWLKLAARVKSIEEFQNSM